MKRKNYESDFIATIVLPRGLEHSDFLIEFSTKVNTTYKVSRYYNEHKNCSTLADGKISVVFKNHGLQPGMLKMKFISFVPNPDIPGDNIQKIVTPRIEDVELVTSAGDECSDITFDIAVDYAVIDAYDMAIKAGYKGSREEYIKLISTGVSDLNDEMEIVREALAKKVDKVDGKTLTSNDFTDSLKSDLVNAKKGVAGLIETIDGVITEMVGKLNNPDGILHIVVSAPTTVTIDGVIISITTDGEHKIPCTASSKLTNIGYNTIGIYRFDGVVMCPAQRRMDLRFINNTTIQVTEPLWFHHCQNLASLANTVIFLNSSNLSSAFQYCIISEIPFMLSMVEITDVTNMFDNCKNLKTVPLFDTSKCTSFESFCNTARSLTYVPLYDTSSATTIQNMFTGCNLFELPNFDFSKVTNIVTAFALMPNIVHFTDRFNFSKVTTATYAFAGDWGYYDEQIDTYQIRGLKRFPAYSLPECTDLQGAWMDQSRLFSIGKLDIPKCTKLDTAFHGCSSLTAVGGFTGLKCNLNMAHCKKLTVTSMVNIFNEAANVTALGVRNMVFGAVNLAKLTDAQKAIATAKGWTLS